MIVEYLSGKGRVGKREISMNFLRALPADISYKINFRMQITKPTQHVDEPYTLKELFDTGVDVFQGTSLIDTYNPYSLSSAFVNPPQLGQQMPTMQPQYPYIGSGTILPPFSTFSPHYPYGQQVMPQPYQFAQPAAPASTVPTAPQAAPQAETYQPLPRAPGIKTEDVQQIATALATAFASQLQPLFQQRAQGGGQNRSGGFTCNFCGNVGHGVRNCDVAQRYINENRIKRDGNRLVLPDGSQISRGREGENMKDAVDRLQSNQTHTTAMVEIVSPAVQETSHAEAAHVNMRATVQDEEDEELDAEIRAREYEIYELRKRRERFDGVEMPPRNKGKAKEKPPAASSSSQPITQPAPNGSAPAPLVAPHAKTAPKPSIPVTRDDPKVREEPNFRYAAPIENKDIGNSLYNRLLDAQVTVTAREILATSPEVRRNMKEATTTRKVPSHVATGQAYITTDPTEAFQQSLNTAQIYDQLIVAKDSHSLRAITPIVEGLHEIECILDNGSQIVSMSEAVWLTLNRPYNPNHKISLQSANGTRDWSLGIVENLELEIGGMKLYVQAHVIREPAYNILLGRPFDVLTTSIVKNHRNEDQIITLHDPNSDKVVTLATHGRGQPRFKMPPPENMNKKQSF